MNVHLGMFRRRVRNARNLSEMRDSRQKWLGQNTHNEGALAVIRRRQLVAELRIIAAEEARRLTKAGERAS